jgi:DNA-binding transcriptional MerR regulator
MFKIGEFSKLGQVSVRMLRHYDQLGLLTPNHTDQFTGYRYYTIDQLARLNRIVALKELGFSLEQVAQLLEKRGAVSPEKLRGMLTLRRAELERELRDKHTQLVEVEARLHQIEQEGQPSPYEIVVKALPAYPVASVRHIVPSLSEMEYYCRQMYAMLYAALDRLHLPPMLPELTVYHTDEYREVDLEVEAAVVVEPALARHPPASDTLAFRELPPTELAATLIYEGPFSALTPAILALLTYIGAHRHTLAGPLREVHLSGPAHDADGRVHPRPIIELQIPIQKIAS